MLAATDSLPFGVAPRQAQVLAGLDSLARAMPQALILEGGTADERAAMAMWLAARLNCGAHRPPCGVCPVCIQIRDFVFKDLLYFDGGLETIKVADMREVRALVGEPPRGAGWRVVILAEAQALTDEAANALLKAMEEPRPGNAFVLLTPQRERLFLHCLLIGNISLDCPEHSGRQQDQAEKCQKTSNHFSRCSPVFSCSFSHGFKPLCCSFLLSILPYLP